MTTTIRLSDHQKRILSFMEMGKLYDSADLDKIGFRRGVKCTTIRRLREMGFIKTLGDYHYPIFFRKIKEHETWSFAI